MGIGGQKRIPYHRPQLEIGLYYRGMDYYGCYIVSTGWTTNNSWLAFWSFKGFYWRKSGTKTKYKKSESDISVCYTINRADMKEEVAVGTLYYCIPGKFCEWMLSQNSSSSISWAISVRIKREPYIHTAELLYDPTLKNARQLTISKSIERITDTCYGCHSGC